MSQTAAVSFSSDFILQYSGNIFLKNHFGTKLHKNYYTHISFPYNLKFDNFEL